MRVRGLSKTYRTKGGEIKALEGITFDLPERGMVFVLGRSGSGKSTLLNLLSGLDKADEGSVIEVSGKDIVKSGEKERNKYRNSCCGFVFQEYNLIPELNIAENVELSLALQGGKENGKAVEQALSLVGLEGYGARKTTELSGGQKQRVAIARALIKRPEIVFADEPTGALDESTGSEIFEILKSVSRDRLVVVVSHDRAYAQKYGYRIIELSDGRVVNDSGCDYEAVGGTEREYTAPKLPIKTAFKIGCANFKQHPIRLVATLLLCVIAFTLLGVALSSAFTSYADLVYDAMLRDGTEYSAICKYLDDTEMLVPIKSYESESIRGVADVSFGAVILDGTVDVDEDPKNLYDVILPTAFSEITYEIVDKCAFVVFGSLPQVDSDICLTAFSADIINRLYYKEVNYIDMIGKSVSVCGREYIISGIVDTHFDGVSFDLLKTTQTDGLDDLFEKYAYTLATSVHNLMFVSGIDEYIDRAIETVYCELEFESLSRPVRVSEIMRSDLCGAIDTYSFGNSLGGNFISYTKLLELMQSVECNITYDGVVYRNFGDLFGMLIGDDYSPENMIRIYSENKERYGFPDSYECRLADSVCGFEYEITVDGVFTGYDVDAFIVDMELYAEIYGLIGGEYDIIIVGNSDSVIPYINGRERLYLDNYIVQKAKEHRATINDVKRISGILSAVFAVFATLLLLNFLLQSFTDKYKTLGILKSGGCDDRGLLKIFVCEAFVIAAAVAVASCVFTIVICVSLNISFGISFFGAHYAVIPVLSAAVAAVAAIACVLPIVRTMRLTPKSVIDKGE